MKQCDRKTLLSVPLLSVPLLSVPLCAGFLLVVAWGLELGLGWQPCQLCWYQRYVMMGILGTGILGTGIRAWGLGGWEQKMVPFLLWICSGLWLLGVWISFYHTGVEWGWWVHACSQIGGVATDTDALLKYFQQENHLALCLSERRILGFPLPFWNILLCGVFLIWTMMVKNMLSQDRREQGRA